MSNIKQIMDGHNKNQLSRAATTTRDSSDIHSISLNGLSNSTISAGGDVFTDITFLEDFRIGS